jgi:hypothetical protein
MKRLPRWATLLIVISMMGVMVFSPLSARADDNSTNPAARIWFREDFTTRANRWRLFDVGKAAISYGQNGLSLRTATSDYALWSFPDTDLKLDRYHMEVEAQLVDGAADALFGVIIGYRSETDLLVLVASRDGNIHLGRYYYGIWSDVTPVTKISLDISKSVTFRAIVDADHVLKISINGQNAGETTIQNFKAGGFGLFALSGKKGGVEVAFRRFVVSDIA